MDADLISSDDLIGMVVIDLSSVLNREAEIRMKGWFPIYDIYCGVRGELEIEIKLVFARDENIAKSISSSLV